LSCCAGCEACAAQTAPGAKSAQAARAVTNPEIYGKGKFLQLAAWIAPGLVSSCTRLSLLRKTCLRVDCGMENQAPFSPQSKLSTG
jgi:hypothetical protein